MTTKDARFYIRVDAGFWDHPKAVAAGRDGRDLYLAALAWTRAQLQDGRIPATMLSSLAFRVGMPIEDGQAAADRLVEVGLWERTPDGWEVHDYAEHQLTAAEIEEQRQRWRDKKQRQRHPESKLSPGDTPETPPRVPRPETESETETELSSSGPVHQELSTGRDDDDDPKPPPPPPPAAEADPDEVRAREAATHLGRMDSLAAVASGVPVGAFMPHTQACAETRWAIMGPELVALAREHAEYDPVDLAVVVHQSEELAEATSGAPPGRAAPPARPLTLADADPCPKCRAVSWCPHRHPVEPLRWCDDDGWHEAAP